MDIGKYIQQLLLEYDTVIIPGFGAFVSTYKPAELNDDLNELRPPSKTISFNQQIRNNDGLLVGKVADGELISHFDALKEIEKERENIIYHLDKSEKFILSEIGELFLNEKNEIELIPEEEENLLLDSFGLESVVVDEFKEESAVADNVINKEEELLVVNTPEEEEIVKEQKNETEEIIVPTTTEDIITETPKEEEQKKKGGWIWLLIVLIPIIGVGIYLVLNQTKQKDTAIETNEIATPEIKQEPIKVADTIVVDTTPTLVLDSMPVKEDEVQEESIDNEGKPKFYLVGGSFKIEENANTYFSQLKDDGFEPFHLGKRGNFYIVGIGTYNSEKEALEARSVFYEKNPDSDVWIMEE